MNSWNGTETSMKARKTFLLSTLNTVVVVACKPKVFEEHSQVPDSDRFIIIADNHLLNVHILHYIPLALQENWVREALRWPHFLYGGSILEHVIRYRS